MIIIFSLKLSKKKGSTPPQNQFLNSVN